MFYFGQRKIRINRQTVSASKQTGRIYLIAYQDNIKKAIKQLSASAFKCYLVLMMNKDQYQIDYSPQYFSSVASICRDTARKALKQLCQKNYLVKLDDKNYDFYEYPPFFLRKEKEQKRTVIDKYTGEVFHYTYKQLKALVNEQTANKLWQEAKVYEQE